MSSLLYRIGRGAARARWAVLAAWLAVLLATGGFALAFGQGTEDTFEIPGSESQDTLAYLDRVFPEMSGASAQLVLVTEDGQSVDTAEVRAAVGDATERIAELEQVAAVADPFDEQVDGALAPDGQAALITVSLAAELGELSDATTDRIAALAAELENRIGPGAAVHTGGEPFEELLPQFTIIEALGVAIALAVLLVLFRSVRAAMIPLVTALIAVGISMGLIFSGTALSTISSTAPMLAAMLGLAVGIDYALFILSRHREQLAQGRTSSGDGAGAGLAGPTAGAALAGTTAEPTGGPTRDTEHAEVVESIARAVATAGSAVIFAGVTVMIALLALFVAGIPFLTAMGVAAAGAVAVSVTVAITLIPALAAFAGTRLRPSARGNAASTRVGFARRWVRGVMRAPKLTIVVLVVGLGLLAVPATGLALALPDGGSQEQSTPARAAHDAVAEHFGPGWNGPLLVTADVIGSSDPVGVTEDIAEEIAELDGVAEVPVATPNPGAEVAVIQVVPQTAPDSAQTERLVAELRGLEAHFVETYGVSTAVTGLTAIAIDISDRLGDAFVPFGLLVVGFCLVLLAMVFRSVWVPVKASLGYLLSLAAAFGATALVFRYGYGAEALNVPSVGLVISFLPIMLMGILFGLAMDYQVYLVSRIRESYVHGNDPRTAIEEGFVSVSRVVVAAAVIMVAVFAAFVPDGMATIQPIAFSLAVGVFVDAFLVRMTLVPAVLALLGERAWGLPRWLDRRLPAFDAEGGALERELRLAGWPQTGWPQPGSAELVSARGLRIAGAPGASAGHELHLRPGEVLAVGGAGARPLLYALGGRVRELEGDVKVLGWVLPQRARAVRTRVALIACREVAAPADAAHAALDAGIALLLLDGADGVTEPSQRASLRHALARVRQQASAAAVLGCHDPRRLGDLLSPADPHLHTVSPEPEPSRVPARRAPSTVEVS